MNEENEAPRPKLSLGVARFEAVNAEADQKQPESVDPIRTAAEVAAHIREAEAPLSCEKRRSRRARDYWIGMLIGNLVILALLWVLPRTVAVWVLAGSAFVIFNLGFAWILWQVMDDN